MGVSPDDNLKHALVRYNDCDLAVATFFELRPVSDGEYTCSTYLYGEDTSHIQVRMGKNGEPSEMVAKYYFEQVIDACSDFFMLSNFAVPLWYSGNDLLVRVTNRVNLATQIADGRFSAGDQELKELFENIGLDDAEQADIRAALGL